MLDTSSIAQRKLIATVLGAFVLLLIPVGLTSCGGGGESGENKEDKENVTQPTQKQDDDDKDDDDDKEDNEKQGGREKEDKD